MKELKLETGAIFSIDHNNAVDITAGFGYDCIYLTEYEAKQLLEFLQANLTTKSNEDEIATKIAVSEADEFVKEYHKRHN